MFLTTDELATLTGYTQTAAQRRWLTRHGYPHELTAGGRPVVARAYVEIRLGVKIAAEPQKARPNLSALRKVA